MNSFDPRKGPQPNQNFNPLANMDPKDLPNIECDKCGNVTFVEQLVLKKVSALLSPDGTEKTVPISVVTCSKCGAILKEIRTALGGIVES